MITISDEAKKCLAKIINNHESIDVACKLFVENPGTSRAETFLCFHEKSDWNNDDICLEFDNFKLFLDTKTLAFLKDTKLNYDKTIDQITIKSPNAKKPQANSAALLNKKTEDFSQLRNQSVNLIRNCKVNLVPHGDIIELEKGTEIIIMQALGNSFSLYSNGSLYRLSKIDGDAIGLDKKQLKINTKIKGIVDEAFVFEQLKNVFDPEIPVNIVDLGLVYNIKITEPKKDNYKIKVIMTLTALGCGMGDIIALDAKETLEQFDKIIEANVQITFEPQWDKNMMSEEAKLKLGFL